MNSLVIPANFVANLLDDLEESTNTRLSSGVTAYGEDVLRELVEERVNRELVVHREELEDEVLEDADPAHDEFMYTQEVLGALEGAEDDITVEQEVVYTTDILDVFADQPREVEEALDNVGYDGLSLMEAVSMGVQLFLEDTVRDAVTGALDEIRDAVEDYEL